MKTKKLTTANRLCHVMTKIYEGGLTTVSGGNLSQRDQDGNIWVTPSGGDKGRYKEEDILMITEDNQVIGMGRPSVETGIHQSILEKRREFSGIVHAHPPALVAVSLLRELPETMLLPKVANSVKNIKMAAYGCPGSEELRNNVERAFLETENTNAVILENHGAFVASEKGVEEAFGIFQDLDFSVRIQAKATSFSAKAPKLISKEQLERYNSAERPKLKNMEASKATEEVQMLSAEQSLRECICDFAGRAYKRGLLSSNMGVISARLAGDTFVITQTEADRSELTPQDLVKVRGSSKEEGKIPSKSVVLHRKIYEENPEINAIIMASPVNAMVFAVTDLEYDLKTIPECYIVLREKISKFPFGYTITNQEELARYFREKSPVAIIENDCYVCTGSSLFNAFDKLEVIEFSADAVLQAKLLGGTVKPITEAEVIEIKEKFKIT